MKANKKLNLPFGVHKNNVIFLMQGIPSFCLSGESEKAGIRNRTSII
jgi:hypothetical protein